jgi:hypothetical protein
VVIEQAPTTNVLQRFSRVCRRTKAALAYCFLTSKTRKMIGMRADIPATAATALHISKVCKIRHDSHDLNITATRGGESRAILNA